MASVGGILTELGALAEMLGVYRDALMLNGFTREEALVLCSDLMCSMVTDHGEAEDV